MFNRMPIIALRVIVGGFFVLSGFMKLTIPPEEVEAIIRAYKILPFGYTYPVALVLPWIEIIPGILLVGGIFPFYMASVITVMLGSFVLLLITTIIRGIPIEDCGCLGGWIKETPPIALVRDIILLLMSIPILRFYYPSNILRRRLYHG